MADINLKTLTPDTSLPTTGFLFGADSQATANPSVYSTQTVATTLLGSTSLTGDTLTASAPVLNLAQTWNNVAVTFTGMKFNATDTTSAAASLLMDLQVGGTSKFSVDKSGNVNINKTGAAGPYSIFIGNQTEIYTYGSGFGTQPLYTNAPGGLSLFSNTASLIFGASNTVTLTRKAAANLRFGADDAASPVAQTLSVQSVVAGTSNTAGADWTLTGSQNTGSGLAGNLIVSTAFANTVGTATVTITIATPGVITWTAHGLVTGSPVVFTTTGALPTGITAGTTYFAITSSTLGVNTFQIATSAANAAAGTAVATSGTQSGVQTGTTSATVQSPLMTTTTFGPSGLTGSQTTPVLDLRQTWNTSGVATGLKLNVTNTASSVSSLLIDLQVGAASKFNVDFQGSAYSVQEYRVGGTRNSPLMVFSNAMYFKSTGTELGLWWSATAGTAPALLQVGYDAANAFAQRNGVNAQTFRVYNTYTDGSNYERGVFDWTTTANTLTIGTQNAGSGSARNIFIGNGAKGVTLSPVSNSITLAPQGGAGPVFDTTGMSFNGWFGSTYKMFGTTQAGNSNRVGSDIAIYPLGGSGNATAGQVTLYASLAAAAGTAAHTFEFAVGTFLPATGTPGLQFGGTTSSFPALKRSSTTLQARLADDSAFASVQGKLTTDNAYTAGAVVQTGYVTIYDSTGTAYKVLVGT